MNFTEKGPQLPETKEEQAGVFVTKELEGKTFYSASASKRYGTLKPLVIKEVGYTHTTLSYGKREEEVYATGNCGKGALLSEVFTFEEAQKAALDYWEKMKLREPEKSSEADEKIKEIQAAVPSEMPSDPMEVAKETHADDLARWKQQVEKIMPLIEAAKNEILKALQSDADTYSESKRFEVSEIIHNITGHDPERAAKGLIGSIKEANIGDIEITGYGSVQLKGNNFGKIDEYKTLRKNHLLVLRAFSLLRFLERLPVQIMETDLGHRFFGEMKEQTIREDDQRAAEWLLKKEKLERLLEEIGKMNISEKGTLSPSYMKVVK